MRVKKVRQKNGSQKNYDLAYAPAYASPVGVIGVAVLLLPSESFRSILFRMVNPQHFPDSELVERNPKLDIDALYRAGALFTGQISRWACHWLTVTIRAEWRRIWIDGQEVAIARDRFLNG